MQLAPAGDNAVLVELGEVTADELHAANARAQAVQGVIRSTPGHSSLYVIFDGKPDPAALTTALTSSAVPDRTVANEIPVGVEFDGEDLPELLKRVPREEFLRRVEGMRLTARYIGFRGGFAYLDGWPEEWAMPRRTTSRPVKRGSFAIAGSVAAFYPIDSPGGWNVLGHAAVDLENAIAPGDTIVLRCGASFSPALRDSQTPDDRQPAKNRLKAAPAHEINAPLATWTAAPFDTLAASLANRAVGNDDSAELLECPLVGPRVRFTRDAAIAWCTPDLRIETARVMAGEERRWGRVERGLRAYLAIGDREVRAHAPGRGDRHIINAMGGPHDIGLRRVECEVTSQLDRVGVRLRPVRPVEARIPADLRSIGMQVGTVQLHPNGDLVAMGPDHPATGGYLQPMTVLTAERWKLAQLVPGERVTFVAQEPNS